MLLDPGRELSPFSLFHQGVWPWADCVLEEGAVARVLFSLPGPAAWSVGMTGILPGSSHCQDKKGVRLAYCSRAMRHPWVIKSLTAL